MKEIIFPNSYASQIEDTILAINAFKYRRDYEDANLFFNSLIEKIFSLNEKYGDDSLVLVDVKLGIEKSDKEYYSLAYIEFNSQYACIPTPLLSHKAARYLLVHRNLNFVSKRIHNREYSSNLYDEDELTAIKNAKEFLSLCDNEPFDFGDTSILESERITLEAQLEALKRKNIDQETKEYKEIQNKINAIDEEIAEFENKKIEENIPLFIEEIITLLEDGPGVIQEDAYAYTRLYSNIPGVKNITFGRTNDTVYVKVLEKKGYYLPDTITVRGNEYEVFFRESSKYM